MARSITSTPIVALLGVAAIALAGYAAYRVMGGAEYDEMAQEAYLNNEGEPFDVREEHEQARERLAAVARGVSRSEAERRHDDPLLAEGEVAAPVLDPSGRVTPADAEAGFDYAMRRVEQLASTRKRLKIEEWESLYREANDAFSAYSIHLDATDAEQAAALEDAHLRLRQGLKRVRVRGKKLAH